MYSIEDILAFPITTHMFWWDEGNFGFVLSPLGNQFLSHIEKKTVNGALKSILPHSVYGVKFSIPFYIQAILNRENKSGMKSTIWLFIAGHLNSSSLSLHPHGACH